MLSKIPDFARRSLSVRTIIFAVPLYIPYGAFVRLSVYYNYRGSPLEQRTI
jgi:hypothetical protein